MTDDELLAEEFERFRPRLRALAYRMLSSHAEAEDAVQETWIRLSRPGRDQRNIDNLEAWLTTVAARVCLNLLRARAARPEDPVGARLPDPILEQERDPAAGPEHEAVLGDSVGLALLIVLDSLAPAERVAFVLHDLFRLTFDEIAPVVGRSSTATRQLASRARRRVRTARPDESGVDSATRRGLVSAFFAAARNGDFDELVALLDPDVVLRADGGALLSASTGVVRGAADVARRAVLFDRPGATVRAVLVNGSPGALLRQDGMPVSVMGFTIGGGKIRQINILLDPERLGALVPAIPA